MARGKVDRVSRPALRPAQTGQHRSISARASLAAWARARQRPFPFVGFTPDHGRREYIASLSVLSSVQPFTLIEGAAMAGARAVRSRYHSTCVLAEPALTIYVPPGLGGRVHPETSLNSHQIISKEATVNGLRIFYRIAGSGRPLLLLHGSPLTSRSWLGVMTSLAQAYTVVAPDFRGYGKSDKPETGYQVQTMVEDIRQLVHQLRMGPVDVVGHDLGGIVAYVYAAKYMQEVSPARNN